MNAGDLSVTFPAPGRILLRSRALFADAENPFCRLFLERIAQAEEISGVIVTRGETPQAELRFSVWRWRLKDVVGHLASLLSRESAIDPPAERVSPGWEIKVDRPGRLRVKNPLLYRKSQLCRAIERELMSVIGVDRYKTSSITCAVQVDYDPRQLTRKQVIEILDSALAGAEHPDKLDALDLHLPLSTISLPLAAFAQFAAPPLLPIAAVVVAYTSIPTFQAARRVFLEEKRVGVDALDAVVVVGCLGTMSVFPGAVMSWCLSFGRFLVRMTRDNSQKMLLNAFGKQPRYAWLCKDGVEVQVPAERLEKGDIVVVHTGEVVPVNGQVVEGLAMIDQQTLTGEATPAEKTPGDRVFAATILVGGKVYVMVERSGSETASAQISQILAQTAGHKLSSQHKGERLADRAVLPTLAAGAVGMATMGPIGAVAVLNSDLGTGIRMAAPLAMLSSLALCAHRGILVKDGRALELMNQIEHGPLRQDRNAHPRSTRGGANHRCARLQSRPGPRLRSGRREKVPPSDRPGHPREGRATQVDTPLDRRHPVQDRLWNHRPDQRCDGPARQQAISGNGGGCLAGRHPRGPRSCAPRRSYDGPGGCKRPAGWRNRAAQRSGPRLARSFEGCASAESSTLPSSRATTKRRRESWPSH